jgi:hypothetical protein
MAQVVECLRSKHKAIKSNLSIAPPKKITFYTFLSLAKFLYFLIFNYCYILL